ncbi:MAG: protein RcaC [Phormidesmis priestleyi]|uniref:Protein RcaC n=1 Tax=Phormidesmis priestleyi TaxID=268141 RepID=A0A2W4X711_9CYAN|nr:MAG: protein RcaC [Phormidesmis priestleyi]
MKFLLVEDDQTLAGAIKQLLTQHHYVIDLATDGLQGKEMAEAFAYDLILLDWTLPKLDGMQLCKYLRSEGNHTPIILLTTRNHSTDKVAGLDAGADDYLAKPFGFEELLARIRALLRRSEGIVSPVLQWGDLCLDPSSSQVICRDLPIAVTPKEYALLELFLRNPNRIFSLDSLLDKVWPFEESPSVGSVRTHIKGLRQKLKKADLPDIITTVYGLGYRLKAEEVSQPKSISDSEPKSISESKPESNLDLSSLWQGVSKSYHERVANVAAALRELKPGLIDEAIRQQLLIEAHSLAGSLGSFGFKSVTVQCREVESILDNHTDLSAQHVQQLKALVAQVQQTIAQGLLPRSPAITPELAPSKPKTADTISTTISSKDAIAAAKLLIVDDDLAMLTVVQSLLQPWGFQVKLLSDVHSFWQVLEEFVPDLVLLDVKMPEISGLELCQGIRNAPRWHNLPIVFMSGYSDIDTIQQAFSVGADDYIRKPIMAPELVARVLSWLKRARIRR